MVNVVYGTPREIEAVRANLPGAVLVMFPAFEPFTTPVAHAVHLRKLKHAGTMAAIVIDTKDSRRAEYHSTSDWSERDLSPPSMPVATTSSEHGAFLRHSVGSRLALVGEAGHFNAPSTHIYAELGSFQWPNEHLLIGGHHDIVYGAPGGNDNASGTIAVL